MKILKGLSAYTGLSDYPILETLSYLELAKKKEIDFIFTSAHIDEAQINNELQMLIDKCSELNLELVIDISKKAYPLIEKYLDFVVPRLDYGFSDLEIVDLSNKLRLIELNASLMSKKHLDNLQSLGANFSHIRLSYNFYPKRYTAFDIEKVESLNKLFKEYGLTILAYIPSNSNKRPPLYDGLPSVESHRYKDIKISSYELIACGCDGICIGDAYATDADLDKLISVSSDYFEIPINIYNNRTDEELNVLNSLHTLRLDESAYMKRSSVKRGTNIIPNNTKPIEAYMITIDNNNYLRYKGELGIALRKMENKGSVNVVGEVIKEAHTLVDLIKAPAKIMFKINN